MIKWKINGKEVENLLPLCKSVNIRDIYSEFTERKEIYHTNSSSKPKYTVTKVFNFGVKDLWLQTGELLKMPIFSRLGCSVIWYAGFLRKVDIFASCFSLAKKSRQK